MRREDEEKTGGAGTRRGSGAAGNQSFWNGMEGVPGYLDGEGHHEREQVKSSRRESEAPGKKVKKFRVRKGK